MFQQCFFRSSCLARLCGSVLLTVRSEMTAYYFFYPRYQGSRGVWKKLEENCRNDHYSGQSSNTKESCSSTPLNRCTSTETRWNKKAVSCSSPEWWLIFFARSEKKVRSWLINWVESLDRNWLKKVVCCKTRIFVFFLSCRQLGYWSSFSGSRGNTRDKGQTTVTSQTRDLPLCHGTKVSPSGLRFLRVGNCCCRESTSYHFV